MGRRVAPLSESGCGRGRGDLAGRRAGRVATLRMLPAGAARQRGSRANRSHGRRLRMLLQAPQSAGEQVVDSLDRGTFGQRENRELTCYIVDL